MARSRTFIHSKLTKEVLLEIPLKYKFANEVLRDMKINTYDLKRAYIHFNIPYPFTRVKGVCYKPRSVLNEDFFSEETEQAFYYVGFLAADGYIRENKRKNGSITYFVSCGLARKDRHQLEQFKADLKYTGKIYDQISKPGKLLLQNKTHKEEYYSSSIEIVSKKLFDDLKKFGLTPAKTYDYTLPDWLVNHKFVNHFIRGYIDGDGSIGKHKNRDKSSLRISLLGACPAVKQIFDILTNNCKLRRGGSFFQKENRFNTIINYFEFNSIYDFKQITDYLYKDATRFLERKYESIALVNEILENCDTTFLDEDELQKRYDELGSFSAVAREYGCSDGIVSRTLTEYGSRINTREEINENHCTYNFDPEKLRKEYDQYQSSNKLAEIYDCSTFTILFYLKKFEIKHLEKSSNFIKKYFIDFNENELRNKYDELRTISKLTDFYGCDTNTIRKAFKKFDIKAFPNPGPNIKYVFDAEILKNQYEELKSIKAVSKIYGCDPAIIRKAMKALGIFYSNSRNQFNCTVS